MYKKILVPTDGSATANLGLQEAVKLAKEQGAASVETEPSVWSTCFYDILRDFRFIPAGRIHAGAGTGIVHAGVGCDVRNHPLNRRASWSHDGDPSLRPSGYRSIHRRQAHWNGADSFQSVGVDYRCLHGGGEARLGVAADFPRARGQQCRLRRTAGIRAASLERTQQACFLPRMADRSSA